jgi:prepilin-type N-terminal cleavage/methylation domain-containing protein
MNGCHCLSSDLSLVVCQDWNNLKINLCKYSCHHLKFLSMICHVRHSEEKVVKRKEFVFGVGWVANYCHGFSMKAIECSVHSTGKITRKECNRGMHSSRRDFAFLFSNRHFPASSVAFTLVELLVTIAIIGILASLLITAVSSSRRKSLKAGCLNNLRQIGVGTTVYAGDNQDYVIPAKRDNPDQPNGSFVQIALEDPNARSCKEVGLDVNSSNRVSVWSCPDRPGLPIYEEISAKGNQATHQWILGYQYFGGITNWVNPSFPNGVSSRSPVKLTSAKPTWCLAADADIKAGSWGAISTFHPGPPFENMPPHGRTRLAAPPGGNELFADGSARWIQFELMYFLTTWKTGLEDRQAFFYQDTGDFGPQLAGELQKLQASNFK